MFENLSDRLERSFKILKGEGKITRNQRGGNHEGCAPCTPRRRRKL